jgi:hypothetical protein
MGKKKTSAVVKIRTALATSAMSRALEEFPNNLRYSDKFQDEKLCKEITASYPRPRVLVHISVHLLFKLMLCTRERNEAIINSSRYFLLKLKTSY